MAPWRGRAGLGEEDSPVRWSRAAATTSRLTAAESAPVLLDTTTAARWPTRCRRTGETHLGAGAASDERHWAAAAAVVVAIIVVGSSGGDVGAPRARQEPGSAVSLVARSVLERWVSGGTSVELPLGDHAEPLPHCGGVMEGSVSVELRELLRRAGWWEFGWFSEAREKLCGLFCCRVGERLMVLCEKRDCRSSVALAECCGKNRGTLNILGRWPAIGSWLSMEALRDGWPKTVGSEQPFALVSGDSSATLKWWDE